MGCRLWMFEGGGYWCCDSWLVAYIYVQLAKGGRVSARDVFSKIVVHRCLLNVFCPWWEESWLMSDLDDYM